MFMRQKHKITRGKNGYNDDSEKKSPKFATEVHETVLCIAYENIQEI